MSAIQDVYRSGPGVGGKVRLWIGVTVIAVLAALVLRWSLWDAVFLASDSTKCRASGGACWAVVTSQWKLVIFGTYPLAWIWRPSLATVLLVGALAAPLLRPTLPMLAGSWAIAVTAATSLFDGRPLGLPYVEPHDWGGLPVTLLLSEGGILFAFPIGLALALARSGRNVMLRSMALVFVESIRGVPLISLLFFATLVLPLFVSGFSNLDKLYGAAIAIVLFNAAYISEVFRGGLKTMPPGQSEAARALGLRWINVQRLVVLPQVFRISAPSLINQAVGTVKDTSLIAVLGIFDFMNAAKLALVDIRWRENFIEIYIVIGVTYFLICTAISFLGVRLASRLKPAARSEPTLNPVMFPSLLAAGGQT